MSNRCVVVRSIRASALLFAIACAAGVAPAAGPPRVIFSTVQSSATSLVPGLGGVRFQPGTTLVFDRPFGSATGQRWVLTALATYDSTHDEIVITGTGDSAAGAAVIAREGTPVPFDAARAFGAFDTHCGINDAGQVVFVSKISGSVANDHCVFEYGPSGYLGTPFREGQPAPGFPGATISQPSTALDAPSILSDGTVCARVWLTGGSITTATNFVVYRGSTPVLQKGVTIPAGSTWTYASIPTGEVYFDAAGGWVLRGTDNAPATVNDIAVANNALSLREGQTIPGLVTPIAPAAIRAVSVAPGGDWFARGNNTDIHEDWLVRNGVLLARVGTDITPAAPSGELFNDPPTPVEYSNGFFAHTGNSHGDYVVGGYTDAAATRNAVIVLNGTRVIARTGDGVDINADGQANDGLYLDEFELDSVVLSDALRCLFLAKLRDAAGTTVAEALVVVDANLPPPTCVADMDDGSGTGTPDGGVTIDDLLYYLAIFDAGAIRADVDDGTATGTPDGGVTIDDLLYYLFRFDLGC